jgi:hypothetical protein
LRPGGRPPPLYLSCRAIKPAAHTEGWGRLLAGDIEALRPQIEGLAGSGARRFLEIAGAALPAPDLAGLASAFVTRHRLLREWAAFQERYPVLLAPIATSPPFPAGADLDERGAAAFVVALRMVVAINFLGLPAVAVPAGPGGSLRRPCSSSAAVSLRRSACKPPRTWSAGLAGRSPSNPGEPVVSGRLATDARP